MGLKGCKLSLRQDLGLQRPDSFTHALYGLRPRREIIKLVDCFHLMSTAGRSRSRGRQRNGAEEIGLGVGVGGGGEFA